MSEATSQCFLTLPETDRTHCQWMMTKQTWELWTISMHYLVVQCQLLYDHKYYCIQGVQKKRTFRIIITVLQACLLACCWWNVYFQKSFSTLSSPYQPVWKKIHLWIKEKTTWRGTLLLFMTKRNHINVQFVIKFMDKKTYWKITSLLFM